MPGRRRIGLMEGLGTASDLFLGHPYSRYRSTAEQNLAV